MNISLAYLSSFWNFIIGPSRRELELSRQRIELIERAEHAEQIAYQALADASEITREREQLLHRIRELEQQLASQADKQH